MDQVWNLSISLTSPINNKCVYLLNLQSINDYLLLPENLYINEKRIFKSNLDELPLSSINRITSFLRIMPDFFIGGVQKGGTTSLYSAITQHPQIIPAKFKEVFFYGNDEQYKLGLSHYRQFFATNMYKSYRRLKAGKEVYTLDASTNTFENPKVPSRILKNNPKAKVIFIFRNPVDRTFSHYNMALKKGWELADLRNALDLEEKRLEIGRQISEKSGKYNFIYYRLGYKERSKYINSLKFWFNEFPRENILILSSEEFFKEPQKVFNEVCDFLALDKIQNVKFEKLNEGNGQAINPEIRAELANYFKSYNEEFYTLTGEKFNW